MTILIKNKDNSLCKQNEKPPDNSEYLLCKQLVFAACIQNLCASSQ